MKKITLKKPIIPIKELPQEIYISIIKQLFLGIFLFMFTIITSITLLSIPIFLLGIIIDIIYIIISCLWIKDYLYDNVYIFEGKVLIKINEKGDEKKKKSIEKRIISRYIRTTYTLQIDDNTIVDVFYNKRPKLKNNMWIRLYVPKTKIIQRYDNSYYIQSVSHTQILHR